MLNKCKHIELQSEIQIKVTWKTRRYLYQEHIKKKKKVKTRILVI